MMIDMVKPEPVHSREFEIDLSVEALIGKLMAGSLTREEEVRYQQLLAQRSRMMRPVSAPTRFRRRAA